jgi:metal-responsive CopG/Arc/MetJ family transcriptional regulator
MATKVLSLELDEELDAALDALCQTQGRPKSELVVDLVRRFVETEKLKQTLQDPHLVALYHQLASEDIDLAEQGMADYLRNLEEGERQ